MVVSTLCQGLLKIIRDFVAAEKRQVRGAGLQARASCQLLRRAPRLRHNLGPVGASEREVADEHLAVNHRQPDVRPARRIDQRGPRVAVGLQVQPVPGDDDEIGALARLERADRPVETRASARRRGWPSRGRRAPAASPGPLRTACSVAASRISSNMSRRLLHAAPSAPSDTHTPRARSSTIGAIPDPSFRLEPGQCSTFTFRSAISACSASVTHTQWAAHRSAGRQARVGEVLQIAQAAG